MTYNPVIHGTTGLTGWTDRLAYDVALLYEENGSNPTAQEAAEIAQELLKRHSMTQEQLSEIVRDSQFRRKVDSYRDDIRDNGVTFRNKARVMGEELLSTIWQMIHDDSTSAPVRADLIKSIVKWADLEPKREFEGVGAGNGVAVVINFSGGAQTAGASPPAIDVTPADNGGSEGTAISGNPLPMAY